MRSNEKKIAYSYQFNNSIKVFISLYKFHQQLLSNKNEIVPKKVILLDKVWFTKYKEFYSYDIISKLIKENNLTDFDVTKQKIIYNNLVQEFYSSKSNKDIFLFYDEEFPELISQINSVGRDIKFINNFEIINEETYKNLINTLGMFKYCYCNAKKYEYEIINKKIIIKYENDEEKCFNLLIGNIGIKNEIYIPEILITFPNKDLLQTEFNDFIYNSEIKLKEYICGTFNPSIVTMVEQNSLEYNAYYNNAKFFVHSENRYPNFQTLTQNKKMGERKLKKGNIIESLVYYYLNKQKLISNNIKDRDINIEEKCFCFLINKSWINKFKTFFNYINFVSLIKNILSNEKFSKFIQLYGYSGLLNDPNLIKDLFKDIALNNFLDIFDEKKIIDELRNKYKSFLN